jgi:hypothetical protein
MAGADDATTFPWSVRALARRPKALLKGHRATSSGRLDHIFDAIERHRHVTAYVGVGSKSLKSNVLQSDPCVSVHASILQSEDVRGEFRTSCDNVVTP